MVCTFSKVGREPGQGTVHMGLLCRLVARSCCVDTHTQWWMATTYAPCNWHIPARPADD